MRIASFWARNRDLVELTIGYLLILIAIWTPPHIQRPIFWLTFSYVLCTTLLPRVDGRALGFGMAAFRQSLWIVGAAVSLAAVQLLVAFETHTLHTLSGPVPVGLHMWGYAIWAFLQQFVLQDFFLLRLLRILPTRGMAVFTAAVLFSVAHLPNPLLTAVTLLWGWAACAIFLKYRSLIALGILHALLGLCFAVSIPGNLHRHMRVGLGYLRYIPEVAQHASARKVVPVPASAMQTPPAPLLHH